MPIGPAVRVTDITVHGSPMVPGTGSMDVLIGFLPAWRAVSPAMVGAFVAKIAEITKTATLLAAAITSNNQPAMVKLGKDLTGQVEDAAKMIAGMDKIVCPTLLLGIAGPPHGPGVILTGSPTVLINGLPACRTTDPIQEMLSVNFAAVGCPTVIIGDTGSGFGGNASPIKAAFQRAAHYGGALVCKGPCAACGHA